MKIFRFLSKILPIFLVLLHGVALAETKDYGAAPEIARAAKALGKKYALVIGVDYPPPYTLDWTGADAEKMGQTLEKVYGFEVERLIGRPQTSKAQILKAFNTLKKKVRNKENAQVVIFFSGHGVQDPDNDTVGYLVPSDGRKEDYLTSAILMNTLQALSCSMKSRHLLFIIDTCFSGIIGGFQTMSYSTAPETEERVKAHLGMRARQVLTAGRSEEKARMAPDKKMSVYSFYLHRALTPEAGAVHADLNGDRVVTVRELQEYVEGKVRADTGRAQNPRIFNFTANDGQFVFVPDFAHQDTEAKERRHALEEELARIQAEAVRAKQRAKDLEARQQEEAIRRQIEKAKREKEEAERRARELEAQRRRNEAERQAKAKAEADRRQTLLAMGSRPKPVSPGRSKTFTNSLGMKFVYIDSGPFDMGSPSNEKGRDRDEKQHRVTLTRGYYMQTTEVTQGQWQAVMGSNPSHFKNCGDDCPVEQVSWNDAQEFINKLNRKEGGDRYRLPTEAEWEYAARAGSSSAYADGGSTEQDLSAMGWYDGNSSRTTHPAGRKKPNAWGLYDMHGNVWEWCQDWYGDYPTGSVTDPTGPSSGSFRVNRGGSWDFYPRNCRSANRDGIEPGTRYNYLGFRLVLVPVR